MALVVIGLVTETLADGSWHVYSPNVPGFHVVEGDRNDAIAAAREILYETLKDRVQEARVGDDVRLIDTTPVEISNFIPSELRRSLKHANKAGAPDRIMVEIT